MVSTNLIWKTKGKTCSIKNAVGTKKFIHRQKYIIVLLVSHHMKNILEGVNLLLFFWKATFMFLAIVFFIVSLFFNQNSFIDVKWFLVSCVFTIVARHMGKIEFENDVVITAYERFNK